MNTLVNPSSTPSINFEFRFDRNPELHSEKANIRTSLVQSLIDTQFSRYQTPVEKIDLYPVARAGKSGSEVFYLDIYLESTSQPKSFIAKFQDIYQTNFEKDCAQIAEFGSLCPTVMCTENRDKDLGLIVYALAKIKNHQEFRGFFLDEDNDSELCALAIKSVLQEINLHENTATNLHNFVDDFSNYINRRHQPIGKMQSIISSSPSYLPLAQIAERIYLAYQKIQSDFNFEFIPCLVHGDLHARNLMLNAKRPDQTELIDFGWTHYGHPAKDFVLLEITLRYMLLSELLLATKKRQRNDPFHIPLKIVDKLEFFLSKNCFTLPSYDELIKDIDEQNLLHEYQLNAIKRVYLCLIEIRKEAGRVLIEFVSKNNSKYSAEQNYFASLFLVTLGLSEFPEMEYIWTLIGLDKMGAAIWQYH